MNMTAARHPGYRAYWTTLLAALLGALCLAMHLSAEAAPLVVGSAMPALSLKDQHDKPVVLRRETNWVAFTGEKAVSDMVSAVLSAEPAGVVERLRLVYVADISGMPALVTRMFALPKLRELSFPIGLVREAGQVAQTADLPRQAGAATLLRLADGRVLEILAVRNAAELRAALDLPVP